MLKYIFPQNDRNRQQASEEWGVLRATRAGRGAGVASIMISSSIAIWGCRAAHLAASWMASQHYVCYAPSAHETLAHLLILLVVTAAELFAVHRLIWEFRARCGRRLVGWTLFDAATIVISTVYLMISWCSLTGVGCHPGDFLQRLSVYTNLFLVLLILVSGFDMAHLMHALYEAGAAVARRTRPRLSIPDGSQPILKECPPYPHCPRCSSL